MAMSPLLEGFRTLPPYGLGAVLVLLLYALQSEIRFGARARSHSTGVSDRGSTLAVSLAALVPVLGFVLAMKAATNPWIPEWFRNPLLPGMPVTAWAGVLLGGFGFVVRIWAVLTLRERYTRTLLTHDQHAVERSGPYRWIRHPGYLGSLLCLNGVAMASGSLLVLLTSLLTTFLAYAYRIRVEDEMLVQTFGETYAAYRRDVGALIPFLR
jgi:protein-S-isoprenylcysteine O-methyltransferase Ste14